MRPMTAYLASILLTVAFIDTIRWVNETLTGRFPFKFCSEGDYFPGGRSRLFGRHNTRFPMMGGDTMAAVSGIQVHFENHGPTK